ncbi:DUF397 domain-containing protein [Micromonospora sp. PTRAS2]|uniref:DUF397 domain-containing protein n=1 Tax=Micromonospora TaxID=1873 RepID=UPI00098D01CB|nr:MULTISPECIES: DUF397 domain-containing protein [unclassified Micromonospora]MDI5940133.1 DUF397 domain-containing protein [Micromonospora sp. DH15]OON29019.1 DUF397 domain-containing protein [Micromonospora sp. Rc5]
MEEINQASATWRKSTRSNGSGDCVEVAGLPGKIGLRDSKDPAGPVLIFEQAPWAAFIEGVKTEGAGRE